MLNVTPDSFSDGGQYQQPELALQHARSLWDAGADWVDVGAESTRPGAASVDAAEELQRLKPIFEGLRSAPGAWSIDSQKPEVMQAALMAGAGMINDVNALQAPGAMGLAADCEALIVLMHRQGEPGKMQRAPQYDDVVADVAAFLEERKEACLKAGVAEHRIILDPGIGFGKTLEHNLLLLRATEVLRRALGAPLMIGVSRKSMFRDLLGLEAPQQRILPSAVAGVWCAAHGVDYLRVHDVKSSFEALKTWRAIAGEDDE